MKKFFLVIFIGLVSATGIFLLPRSVLEQETNQQIGDNPHVSVTEKIQLKIDSLKNSVSLTRDLTKKVNFAHSLASLYLDLGQLDSAVMQAERIIEWDKKPSEKASDIYYLAYERAVEAKEKRKWADKAGELLKQLLKKDSANLFVKNRLAMTKVFSENPMGAIAMLKEVLEEDESNRQAILNLGMLSIQSGQYNKALERFERLLQLYPNDKMTLLYKAVSLAGLGSKAESKEILNELIESNDSIPVIKALAKEYIESL